MSVILGLALALGSPLRERELSIENDWSEVQTSRAQPLRSLEVRYAEQSIVPSEPLPLGGYTKRQGATSIAGGDELKVRTILLSQGGLRVAIVSFEALTVPEGLYDRVQTMVGPKIHVFLAATHTHCAPDSQMLNDRMTFRVPGITPFSKKWQDWYAERISQCIANAEQTSAQKLNSPAMSIWGRNQNRARRADGQPDTSFEDLRLGNLNIGHYAAHATLYDADERHLRGDWPGLWMSKNAGVMLVGAIGDVSPKAIGATPQEKIEAMVAALDPKRPSIGEHSISNPNLQWIEKNIPIPKSEPHPTFAKVNRISPQLAQMAVNTFAPKSAKIRIIKLGDIAFVGVPGEPTGELGTWIRKDGEARGLWRVMVCSHVNGWAGYILMPKDYDRGGYEAELSFFGRDFATRVHDTAISALKDLEPPTLSTAGRRIWIPGGLGRGHVRGKFSGPHRLGGPRG